MQIVLLVAYPILVHLAIVLATPALQVAALSSLTAGLFYRLLVSFRPMAWLAWLSITGGVGVLAWLDSAIYFLYFLPVLLPLLLFAVFFRTLLPGQEPLVTAIGENSRGPLSEEIRHYTRRVTQLWAGCLLSMTIWAALLPWMASAELWSLVTGGLNYMLVGLIFVGEFIYRRFRFPDHNHPGFFEYIRIVAQAKVSKGQPKQLQTGDN